MYLSTTVNSKGRPYAPRTITAYRDAAVSFNTWLTLEERHEGDFTTITTDLLNRYFLWYLKTHSGPAATNTRQRNLHPLFLYLVEDYGHPDPYSGPFRWYSGESSTPKTLSPEFISAMLAVTGGGSAKIRDFQTVRDHAIVRVLTEGLRAEELLSLTVNSVDLPRGVVTVVPLKEARATGTGRIVPIQPPTVQAVRRYLRVRQSHKYSEVDWLWLGTRNRGHLKYNGLWRLIKRLAEQCGYDPSLCSPHGFRHSWASDLMEAGISDGDIMQAAGWKSSDMLRTYGRDVAGDRAVTAIHRLGSRY